MVKKALLTGLVFAGLLFFGLSGQCFADAAALLEQAKNYLRTGWQQQAEQVYKTIVTDYPGSSYALKAQSELILRDIPNKENSQIQAAIDSLIADYSGHSDLPDVLCNIAASYGWSSKHEQAKTLYQQVIQQWPASSAVRKAQLGISRTNIVSLIQAGDYSGTQVNDYSVAEAQIAKMRQDFSDQEYLPAALYQIARTYQWWREFERAESINQEIIRRFPDSSEAERARLDAATTKALSLIKSDDYAAAEAEIDKLMQDFSGHLGLPAVVQSIASEYEAQAKYKKAASLHQQIIQQWPDHSYVERARFDFSKITVLSLIRSDEYAAAEAKLGKFTADFGGHRLFAEAMFVVGEQYYSQALVKQGGGEEDQAKQLYQKAVTAWDGIIRALPQSESTITEHAYFFSAVSCRYLRKYNKAIDYSQHVIDNWPDYQYVWHAQFLIGNCYESLRDARVIPESEANPKIEQAYRSVVEKYPDCPLADRARSKLDQM